MEIAKQRPTKDEYFMNIAHVVSTRATCLRRAVGCVLVNERGHIIATGYNGRYASAPHCNQPGNMFDETGHPFACGGAFLTSGSGLDQCEAIHAEQNALLQCPDVHLIDTCYTTTEPCVTCTKLLLNTSCRRIVFALRYQPHHDTVEALWLGSKRVLSHFMK